MIEILITLSGYLLSCKSNQLFKVLFQVNLPDDISDIGEIFRFVQSTYKILFQWINIWMSSSIINTNLNFINFIFAMTSCKCWTKRLNQTAFLELPLVLLKGNNEMNFHYSLLLSFLFCLFCFIIHFGIMNNEGKAQSIQAAFGDIVEMVIGQ